MKIGILTLPLVSNNGGILQAYALQVFLIQNGYEAILINRRDQPSILSGYTHLLKSIVFNRKYVDPMKISKVNEKPYKFISTYIQPQSLLLSSTNSLKKYIEKNELKAVIIGSDQVWRPEYSGKLKLTFFLDIKTKRAIKRISYAASFGVDTWNNKKGLTKKISLLLHKFDAISVRENTGITICKSVFNKEATQHIDPTFLLPKEHYIKLITSENEPSKNGFFFYYFLDPNEEKLNLVDKLAHFLSAKAYTVQKIAAHDEVLGEIEIEDTVTSWLRGFMDAKYILTDSFHGCVFSIIFNKPFLVIGNMERGLTRFNAVLKLFNLEERLIQDIKKIDMSIIKKPINNEKINQIIENERTRSMNFFKSNLNI